MAIHLDELIVRLLSQSEIPRLSPEELAALQAFLSAPSLIPGRGTNPLLFPTCIWDRGDLRRAPTEGEVAWLRQVYEFNWVLQATSDTASPAVAPNPAPKRSTERGEGRVKLIAALTKHHQYADGGCLNLEPIGNNELAKAAGVSVSTASRFFKDQFGGHTKYKALCRDASKLVVALKLLNDEFAPHHLLGDASSELAAPEQDDADSE
jgi:hypothetical protein